jgi:WD40 repeat protein
MGFGVLSRLVWWAVLFGSLLAVLVPGVAWGVGQQWVSRLDGPEGVAGSDDYGKAVATDATGNVYVAASTSGHWGDVVTVKYDPSGRLLWSRSYNGPANDYDSPEAIAVDGAGNVYVTGTSVRVAGSSDYDFVTVKYDAAGTRLWVARYDSPDHGYDAASAIAVDRAGNVYVTGAGSGNGLYDTELTLVKYAPGGARQWVRTYGAAQTSGAPAAAGQALALGGDGSVFVTGTAFGDYVTVKYNDAGTRQWLATLANPGDQAHSDAAVDIELDGAGNAYVTGAAWGGANPGTWYDALTVKYSSRYDTSGTQRWVRTYQGPVANVASYEEVTDLALDPGGNVVVTGYGNPTAGAYRYDYATVSWDRAGVRRWVARYDGPAHGWDAPYGLAVDRSGAVVVTGESVGGPTSWDVATVKYR